MPITSPAHRLSFALAILLGLALLATLIAPAATFAKTHKAACPSRAGAHAKARARRSACTTHGKATHQTGRHPAAKHPARAHGKAAPTTAAATTPALCEDESSPVRSSHGTFSCADGSEPTCEGEAGPVRSGRTLVCVVASAPSEPACAEETSESFCYTGSAGSDEPTCADGSAPTAPDGGPPVCDDGSEPVCPDGSEPSAAGRELICADSTADDSDMPAR